MNQYSFEQMMLPIYKSFDRPVFLALIVIVAMKQASTVLSLYVTSRLRRASPCGELFSFSPFPQAGGSFPVG
jgi:hypothetical protein